jgi:hypothetical protein
MVEGLPLKINNINKELRGSIMIWRTYESDWRMFMSRCRRVDKQSLPAEPATVALFLAAQAKIVLPRRP